MAGAAEGHQIALAVSTATADGQDVVYLFNGRQPTFLKASLTQRMLRGIAVTDALPRSAVGFIDIRASLEPVVLLPGGFLMLRAVLSVGQAGTARPSARFLRTSRHCATSVSEQKNSLTKSVCPRSREAVLYSVPDHNTNRTGYCLSMSFTVLFLFRRTFSPGCSEPHPAPCRGA